MTDQNRDTVTTEPDIEWLCRAAADDEDEAFDAGDAGAKIAATIYRKAADTIKALRARVRELEGDNAGH